MTTVIHAVPSGDEAYWAMNLETGERAIIVTTRIRAPRGRRVRRVVALAAVALAAIVVAPTADATPLPRIFHLHAVSAPNGLTGVEWDNNAAVTGIVVRVNGIVNPHTFGPITSYGQQNAPAGTYHFCIRPQDSVVSGPTECAKVVVS